MSIEITSPVPSDLDVAQAAKLQPIAKIRPAIGSGRKAKLASRHPQASRTRIIEAPNTLACALHLNLAAGHMDISAENTGIPARWFIPPAIDICGYE